MGKNKVIFLIAFILLVVLSVAVYLFLKLNKLQVAEKNVTQQGVSIKSVIENPDNPIQKSSTLDSSGNENGFFYDIQGKIDGKLVRKNNLLTGNFIIKGDSLERKIPVYIGAVDGTVDYGKFVGSFSNGGSWTQTPLDTVLKDIKPNEPILLKVLYRFSTDPGSNGGMDRDQKFFDTLINEFQNAQFKISVPDGYGLGVPAIGVIR